MVNTLMILMIIMYQQRNEKRLSSTIMIGLLQSVDLAVEMVQNGDLGIPVPDYVDTNVSDKVVWIIQSYVGVVNKMVWRKS